jgi:hypothetical protein
MSSCSHIVLSAIDVLLKGVEGVMCHLFLLQGVLPSSPLSGSWLLVWHALIDTSILSDSADWLAVSMFLGDA